MAKSPHTLPMLFFNLGGEMLYVLDQRLKAQNILEEKANKVLCDIVGQMFEEKFLVKVFTPQMLLSNTEVRLVFDKLAHSSFMRLNPSSMDKLYDLMTMAFKYQVMLCKAPEDLLLVTFNHLDAIREMVGGSDKLVAAVNDAHRQLRGYYKGMNNAEFQNVRHTLLFFFQDIRKRVSILLRDKAQLSDGHFVLPVGGPVARGADIPGTIRYFEAEEVTRCETFVPALPFTAGNNVGSLELQGDRVTNLGTNLYSIRKDLDAAAESVSGTYMPPPPDIGGNPSGKEEFNLLAHLVRSRKATTSSGDTFKLNLFDNDDEISSGAAVVNINASKGDAHLQHILKDFSNLNTGQQSDDILDLLDQAAS